MKILRIIFFLGIIFFVCCSNTKPGADITFPEGQIEKNVLPGITDISGYSVILENKRIAVVGNQTSIINNVHLVDTLLSLKYNIIKVFSPEHGFRGKADAGQIIDNSSDPKTGLPIVSLYGKNKKPYDSQLEDIDIVVFDLQDVGVRFYTYISTLHYVMEACAENNIPLVILDRPNPNAYYIDGPVLDTSKYRSFIGMHPVPTVYGMTIGEYGLMINGEKWLNNGIQCDLTVIKCRNYKHCDRYSLPVKPSPNLPNDRSIDLYPTLCFFEGTNLSIGRGTDKQFQIIGHPLLKDVPEADFRFTPLPNEGASKPDLDGQLCYGFDLSENNSIFEISNMLNISLIQKVYKLFPEKDKFFKKTNFFELLSGCDEFRQQIIDETDETEIRKGWEIGLEEFKVIRAKYLLYE
ncbi:MAG: DUF1343 domain-containing protein [Bacteroidales bacterium]|jgi:uncharacterized protein YbbC (DUF1343 family)|nr:DUF1343 domain-containing protein [Bacteroidales bacterium]